MGSRVVFHWSTSNLMERKSFLKMEECTAHPQAWVFILASPWDRCWAQNYSSSI